MSYELLGHRHWWCPSVDTDGNGTTTLSDLIFGNNDGTLTNMDAATDWVPDTAFHGVRALELDGINDEVVLPAVFAVMPFSVSFWAKPASNNSSLVAFGIGNSSSNTPLFSVAFRGDLNSDPIVAQMRGSDLDSNTWAVSPSGFELNQWHHVVAVYRSASYRQIYVNGVAGTADTTAHTVETLNRMSIGSLPRTTSGSFFRGLIDDVRIFGGEISQDTIDKLASRRAYLEAGGGFTGVQGTSRRLGT